MLIPSRATEEEGIAVGMFVSLLLEYGEFSLVCVGFVDGQLLDLSETLGTSFASAEPAHPCAGE